MVNLLFVSLPYISVDYGLFYILLFVAISVCRYNFNKIKWMLVLGLFGTVVFEVTPAFLPVAKYYIFDFSFSFQVAMTVLSQFYNIKLKLWKRDLVFTIMEPILIGFFAIYLLRGGVFGFAIIQQLNNWFYMYLVFQVSLLLIKIGIGLYISSLIGSWRKKLKIFMYVLPEIDTSYGFNDMGLLDPSTNRIVHPTGDEMIEKQITFLKEKALSIIDDDYHQIKTINKENREFDAKYIKTKKFLSM